VVGKADRHRIDPTASLVARTVSLLIESGFIALLNLILTGEATLTSAVPELGTIAATENFSVDAAS